MLNKVQKLIKISKNVFKVSYPVNKIWTFIWSNFAKNSPFLWKWSINQVMSSFTCQYSSNNNNKISIFQTTVINKIRVPLQEISEEEEEVKEIKYSNPLAICKWIQANLTLMWPFSKNNSQIINFNNNNHLIKISKTSHKIFPKVLKTITPFRTNSNNPKTTFPINPSKTNQISSSLIKIINSQTTITSKINNSLILTTSFNNKTHKNPLKMMEIKVEEEEALLETISKVVVTQTSNLPPIILDQEIHQWYHHLEALPIMEGFWALPMTWKQDSKNWETDSIMP